VDAAPHYGMLSVQGPKAVALLRALKWFPELPASPLGSVSSHDATLGEMYVVNHARLAESEGGVPGLSPRPVGGAAQAGYDLYVPNDSLSAVAGHLFAAAKALGGRACGWTAFETARIEAGIPRFGVDMDETNIPLECGIEARAVSYRKGCYIGQEVINRIHSIGHVNRQLRRLRLADELTALPARGAKLFQSGKEVGCITSAVKSPAKSANLALGYVRREADQPGSELHWLNGAEESVAVVLPV